MAIVMKNDNNDSLSFLKEEGALTRKWILLRKTITSASHPPKSQKGSAEPKGYDNNDIPFLPL